MAETSPPMRPRRFSSASGRKDNVKFLFRCQIIGIQLTRIQDNGSRKSSHGTISQYGVSQRVQRANAVRHSRRAAQNPARPTNYETQARTGANACANHQESE